MAKVAVVSIGGAGTSIMKEMMKISTDYAAYNVNEKKSVNNARYYGYEEIEVLAEELESFDCVVITAGLGSKSGDALAELYGKLDKVRKICFLVSPFYFEIDRLLKSRTQLSKIMDNNFEGAVVSLNSLVKDLEDAEPSRERLEKMIKKFDREMAELIIEMMQEVE
jgi:cell division GTPase FtsZ